MENKAFVFIILLSFVVVNFTFGCSKKPENAELSSADLLKCKEEDGVYYKNECLDKTVLFTGIVDKYSEKNGVRINVVENCDSSNVYLLKVDSKNLDWKYYKDNKDKCVTIFAKIEKQNFFTPDVKVLKTIWLENQLDYELRIAEIERRLEEERMLAEERRKIAEKESEDEKKRKSLELQKNEENAKELSDHYMAEGKIAVSGVAYAAAEGPGKYFVTADSVEERLGPSTDARATNTIYKGQAVEVLEVRDGWARVSKFYDGAVEGQSGQVARWILAEYLGKEKPAAVIVAVDNKLEQALKDSDDFVKFRAGFVKGSQELINSRRCILSDFTKMGGWLRSTEYKPKPIYFTYCGGMTLANKVYINAETGEILK